jgi:hypothetical protein
MKPWSVPGMKMMKISLANRKGASNNSENRDFFPCPSAAYSFQRHKQEDKMRLRAFAVCLPLLAVAGITLAEPHYYSSSEQTAFVRDGKLCRYRHSGITQQVECRAPYSAEELASVEKRLAEDGRDRRREEQCNFSIFRSWDEELERLTKAQKSEEESIPLAQEDARWARRDINNPYLRSDDVRDAYDLLEMSKESIIDARNKIEELRWCIQCAEKRKAGAHSCQQR